MPFPSHFWVLSGSALLSHTQSFTVFILKSLFFAPQRSVKCFPLGARTWLQNHGGNEGTRPCESMVNKTEDNTTTCRAQEPPGVGGSGDESCIILLAEVKVDHLATQSHPYCVLVLFPLCFVSSKPPFPTEEATNGRLKSSGRYLPGLTPT